MKRVIFGIGLFIALSVSFFAVSDTAALDGTVQDACSRVQSSTLCDTDDYADATGIVTAVVNFLLYALGIVAVIMLIIGGIMFATSGGDQSRTRTARNTVMFSVIGLAVAVFAYAIVQFVTGQFTT